MIVLAYAVVLVVTLILLWRHFQGRTVEGLIRNPPAGSDLNTVVSTLSYLEHELIKHRIPVVRGLVAKRIWNEGDRLLLARTIGRGDASLLAELRRYLDGVQRGAGRTLVNFERDRAFTRAEQSLDLVQRIGERWLRMGDGVGPPERERRVVDEACAWLAGPFRHYLVELNRSVFRCPVSQQSLLRSARRGLAEAGTEAELTVADPPSNCIAGVLPADLDVVIRNLVRNAAQAEPSDGVRPAVRIDVDEVLEETGQESVLIRIHDNSPRMLSADEIYGREARRGLGLVTAALGRHRGAVRCVKSTHPGFRKAMEVRLARSLHEPDREALGVGRPPLRSVLLPALAVVVHAALLVGLVIPYFASHPLEGRLPVPPPGCSLAATESATTASLVCDLFDDAGDLRTEPIRIRWPGRFADPGRLDVSGSDCVGVDRKSSPMVIDLHVAPCLREGQLEPGVMLRLASWRRRAEYAVRVDLRSSTQRLVQASRAATARGDYDLARRLTAHLLGRPRRGLTTEEHFDALYWRALTEIVASQSERWADLGEADSPPLCERFHRVEGAVREMMTLAEEDAQPRQSEHLFTPRYLLALAALFITTSLEGAAGLFEELASQPLGSRPVQTARFFLAILLSEGAAAPSPTRPEALLERLWLTYERPPEAGKLGGAFEVDLPGLSGLDGGRFSAPVPEVLCAFRHHYPDVHLTGTLGLRLPQICARRPVARPVDDYVGRLGSFVRRRPRAVACP